MSPDTDSFPIDELPVPVAIVAIGDGRITACNRELVELTGRPNVELCKSTLTDLVGDTDRAALADVLEACRVGDFGAGSEGRLVVRARLDPSGVPVSISLRCSVSRSGESDQSGSVIAVVQDRTDEARYEAIVDATANSTMLLSNDGLVLWQRGEVADPELVRRIGGVGTNPLGLVHPEDLPRILDSFVNAVAHPGSQARLVVRSRAAGPGEQWQRVEVTGSSQLDTPGLEGILVQVRNLGAGEQVESLAETEGKFFSLTDAAPIGIVVGDAFGRAAYLNVAARTLLGQDVGTASESVGVLDWVDRVEPAYREELHAAVDSAVYEGQTTTVTAPFVVADGERRWLRVRVSPRFSAGRQAVGIVTTLDDVTAEVEARADSERLREMLDASSDFVAVFKPGGEALYLNQAIRDLLAQVKQDGGSGELRDLVSDDLRRKWVDAALASSGAADVWRGELELNGGGGRLIPVSALTVVRRGGDGTIDWVAVLARDISDLKRAEAQLREMATHDYLTGLPNRPLFNDRLETAVARHKRTRRGVAVMFCDLDGFKEINDERGHAAGDAVLVAVAERLKRITRESDTAARVGGDEFVVVCEGVTDSEELAALAERIIESVTEPIPLPDGSEVRIGISVGVGVARSRQEKVDPDRLLTLADTAMYRAKARGGNTFRIAALQD